jgi:hypothetical protein
VCDDDDGCDGNVEMCGDDDDDDDGGGDSDNVMTMNVVTAMMSVVTVTMVGVMTVAMTVM